MVFQKGQAPPKSNAARKPVGKTKGRKYAIWYISKYKESADENNWVVGEFRGTSINAAHNAVVRLLRVKFPDLKKSEVLIMEAHVLPPRTTLEQYLANPDDEE